MKLSLVRVLPIVVALLYPAAALAQAPADTAPIGSTAAAHKGGAKGRVRPAKKPKSKTKAKRANSAAKSSPTKHGKKAVPKG